MNGAAGPNADLGGVTDEELAARPFDELIVELQRIVGALEAGTVGLEESIALYRDGLRLHAACEGRLQAAELTISELGRRAERSMPDSPAARPDDVSSPAVDESDEAG